ncbi:DUF2142 domain-containing protein [Arthrobacter sp. UYEF3]|uniref:DUF2142 domain-containing protein n=1 Tax=Arthrobacter sp. UYEF3 TaxID=1756365 RepID=UPI003396D33C
MIITQVDPQDSPIPRRSSTGSRIFKLGEVALSPDTRAGLSFFVRVFAFISALVTLWILATPLMAYPDEPAHTVKAAAVARGQFFPAPGESYGHGVHVQVPSYIANIQSQMCFAFLKDKTANCAPAIPMGDTLPTIGVTSAGLYNPVYYWIVGLPSLFISGAPAIYAMRIVSGLLSAAAYAAGFTALSRLRNPKWPIIAATVATTPMVMFLASGINPNSIEVSASMAAFCGLVSILENSKQLHRARPGILTVGVAAITLANTRNISPLWLLCGGVAALLFFKRADIAAIFRNKLVLFVSGITAIGVSLGVAWSFLMLTAPASAGDAPLGISNFNGEVRPYNAFLTMIDRSFDYVSQYIGVAGWLDAPMPQGVIMFWNMLFVGLSLLVFTVRPYRAQFGFWAALAMLVIVPALVQAAIVNTSGYIWQGRYSLPIFMIAMISTGLALRGKALDSRSPSQRTLGRILILAMCVAHLYGFLTVLRRYVVGLTDFGNWQTMFTVPSWQPPLSWEVLSVLFAVTLLLSASRLFTYIFPTQDLIPAIPRLRAKIRTRIART